MRVRHELLHPQRRCVGVARLHRVSHPCKRPLVSSDEARRSGRSGWEEVHARRHTPEGEASRVACVCACSSSVYVVLSRVASARLPAGSSMMGFVQTRVQGASITPQ